MQSPQQRKEPLRIKPKRVCGTAISRRWKRNEPRIELPQHGKCSLMGGDTAPGTQPARIATHSARGPGDPRCRTTIRAKSDLGAADRMGPQAKVASRMPTKRSLRRPILVRHALDEFTLPDDCVVWLRDSKGCISLGSL